MFRLPELKERILFTLGMICVVRLGAYVPTPGVDGAKLVKIIESYASQMGGLITFLDMFSGGALQKCTLFALGVMPYISASIIIQLLTAVVPALEKIMREGAQGQKKIQEFTRYGTFALSFFQGLFIARFLANSDQIFGEQVVVNPGLLFYVGTAFTLTAGTIFLMWLGEQITEKGISNGISIIITVNILSQLPSALANVWLYLSPDTDGGWGPIKGLVLVAIFIGVIMAVVCLNQGERKIPVQYAKRVVGRRQYAGQASFIPFRVNYAGVIPIIFASSLLLFPATVSGLMQGFMDQGSGVVSFFGTLSRYFSPPSMIYYSMYVFLIIFFCFFWTATQFNPVQMAEDLKRNSAFVPGIRPGKATSDFFDRVMTRITLPGGIFLALVAIFPDILTSDLGLGLPYAVASFFGGTSLLIIVGVMQDTMRQIESFMVSRHYEGFLEHGRLKGRRSRAV